jgi:hypothetical protein
MDNLLIERLWRSLRYEGVSLVVREVPPGVKSQAG